MVENDTPVVANGWTPATMVGASEVNAALAVLSRARVRPPPIVLSGWPAMPGLSALIEDIARGVVGALEKLTSPANLQAKPAVSQEKVEQLQQRRGRPPSPNRARIEAAASMWLDVNGMPDIQAELERGLLAWCCSVGINVSERSVRAIASAAIKMHRARLGQE